MRKWFLASLCLTGVGVVLALYAGPGLLQARAAKQQPADEPSPRAVQLPIGQVVLFSSGVGYFQREGQVEGDARIDLTFPVADINDLIKSMVLRDLDGGAISTVSYDSNAPVDRTLRSFAINLTGTPTFADILHQARGEKAEVALANAGAGTLSGTIVSVEKQKQLAGNGKDTVEQAVLNLWCSDGMRSVKMSEVQRVRFLNPTIESEFKKALETLALSHDTQKKAVSIRCVGEGKRRVKVGYVVENPIWKTSYRLVLPAKGEEKPFLQGWAVVENTSDEDWKDVRMSLVSGRPISFQMDLYQPLFVRRPTVVPDLFEGLNPVAYSGGLDPAKDAQAAWNVPKEKAEMDMMERRSEPQAKKADGKPGRGFAFGGGRAGYADESRKQLAEQLDLGRSVTPSATAAKLGDYFQYAIDRPVSLGRQKSALLPIVGKDVEATRVSIYNERVQAKFPLLGLKLKNSSGLHLMQGPITVFEGSNYAGDSRILDLQPNEERLLSFAIDLGTEVNPVPGTNTGRVTHIKAYKGLIQQTVKVREERVYTMKNRNEQERTILVEHPVRNDFKLVDEKPKETASDVYRFEVKVPAGQTKSLKVAEERDVQTNIAIRSQNDEQIRLFINQAVISEKVKNGLKEAIALRSAKEKTTREIAELKRQLQTIEADQSRIRPDLKETPSTSAVHKRYLEKLEQQEPQIEKYQADIKKLQTEEHARTKAFEDFLASFTAE